MSLLIGFDPGGIPAKIASALDDIIVALQTWAGKIDGAGQWRDIPYDQANFYTKTGGAWTIQLGDLRQHRYSVTNNTMLLSFSIVGSSTGASMSNELFVRLPSGYRVMSDVGFMGIVRWNAGVAAPPGLINGPGASDPKDVLTLLRDVASPSTNWPSSNVNDFHLHGMAIVPVVSIDPLL